MPRPKATYDRIGRRYEVYIIRQGGMGCVYLCIAQPRHLGEMPVPVALKTFHTSFWASEVRLKRFFQEAELWIQVGVHPNVVRAYAVEIIDQTPYIILEWVVGDKELGDNLRSRITTHGLPVRQCIDLAAQACAGLCFISESFRARRLTFVHGDIKPENLLIDSKNTLKVTDFGLSSVGAFTGCQPSVEWEPGQVQFGTLDYMAPELFDGYSSVTTRSDVYSFGCVMYEAICGRPPFSLDPNTLTEDRRKFFSLMHAKYPPKRPRDLRNDLPVGLDEFVMTCLEKAPENRYPDFEAVAAALQKLGRGLSASAGLDHQTAASPQDCIARGLSLMNLGRPNDAITYFDQALDQEPTDEKALMNKGLALAEIGSHEDALRCFEQSRAQWRVVTWEKLAHYDTVRAAALARMGRHDEAFRLFDDVTSRYANYAHAWFEKGVVLSDAGDYREAVSCLTRCVAIAPSFVSAWVTRARALLELGCSQEAMESLDWALRADARSARAWHLRGNVFGRLASVEDALACYAKAVELDPRLHGLSEDRAALIAKFGVVETDGDEGGTHPSAAGRWLAEGIELARHEEWVEAIIRYDQALVENADLADAWSAKARALLMLGRNDKAMTCFDRAFTAERERSRSGEVMTGEDSEPEHRSLEELRRQADLVEERWAVLGDPGKESDAYHVLARVAQEKCDYAAASVWYLRYHNVNERVANSQKVAIACHQLGLIAAEQRQYGEAKAWYLKALAMKEDKCDPIDRASTYHQLGILSSATGDRAAARDWFMKSFAISEPLGKQGATYHELGTLAAAERNWEEAKKWYLRSLAMKENQRDPAGLARTYYHLGRVAVQERDLATARERLKQCLQLSERYRFENVSGSTYHQLGTCAALEHNFEVAREYFLKAISVFEKQGNLYDAAASFGELGVATVAQGRVEEGARCGVSTGCSDRSPLG